MKTKSTLFSFSSLIGLVSLLVSIIGCRFDGEQRLSSSCEETISSGWDHTLCEYPLPLPPLLAGFMPVMEYFDQLQKSDAYKIMPEDTLQLLDSMILLIAPYQEAVYHFTKAFLLYLRGDQFLESGEPENALAELRLAQQWLDKSSLPEDSCILHFRGSLHNRFGLIYTDLFDLDNAVFHFKRAIQLFRLTGEEKELAANYSSLGLAYQNAGEFSTAIGWHEIAVCILENHQDLKAKDTVNLAWIYNGLGIALGYKGDSLDAVGEPGAAQQFRDKAIRLLRKPIRFTGGERPLNADLSKAYAYIFMNSAAQYAKSPFPSSFDSIRYYVDKTLEISPYVWKDTPDILPAVLNRHLAYGYLHQRDCSKAEEHIDKALDLLKFRVEGNGETIIKNKDRFSDFLFSRAFMLKKCAELEPDDLLLLNRCLQAYLEAIDFSESVRRELAADVSLEGFLQARLHQFVPAFEVAVMLYEKEKNKEFLNTAFQIAERSRSFTLRQGVFRRIQKWQGENDKLLEEEFSYRRRIQDLEEQIKSDTSHLGNLHLQAALQAEKEAFSRFIERLRISRDPKDRRFYANRLDFTVASISQVQDEVLDEHTAVVEYLLGFGRIRSLIVTRDTVVIVSDVVDSTFYSLIDRYKNSLSGEKLTYKKTAEQLYEVVFEKADRIFAERGIKNAVIIPDKQLSGVLFEALLNSSNSEGLDFQQIPYLLSRYNIGYHYSMTSLLNNRYLMRNRPQAPNPFAGFTSELPDTVSGYASCGGVRLSNLEKLTEETWKSFFSAAGNGFFPAAKVSDFKNEAENYSIVQLALHGCYAAGARAEFFLEFFPDTSGGNNHLELPEIYTMDLLTQLMVLSNCHTAQGSHVSGEGLMSISRAFAYAGCPNAIAALSDIPDQPAAEILESFYEYLLKDGDPPFMALAEAKRAYILLHNHHPWMWNNLIFMGDLLPIGVQL
jgi:CHAT domain-containing protein/tetratricopeptide (TPR) repeat protein